MSDDSKRQWAVWRLWLAWGLGCGGLAVAFLGFMGLFHSPGFLLLGLAVIVVALAIGVPAGRRVAGLQAEKKDMADTARAAGGFTLGCGLVVGIVLLLPTLPWVYPWFGTGRRASSRKAVCLSNVKNLALAVRMYLEDNDGTFPRADAWCESLEDYIKNWEVLQCPSVRDAGRECDFAFNRALSGANLSDVADPATTVAIFESDIGWNAAGDARNLSVEPRHLRGDNYALADGRALWVKRKDLSLGKADIEWSVAGAE